MDMEREMDRLQDENAALRKELDQERRACTTFHLALQQMATERDALKTWKAFVPVEEIKFCAYYTYTNAQHEKGETSVVYDWLATLDGAA